MLYASHLSNTAPQCSHSLSLSQMGRLDARFLRLPGITRPGIIRAVVQDSAALLGAHLSYRCGSQVVTSRPARHSGRSSSSQSTAEPRFGPDVAAARRQLCLDAQGCLNLPGGEELLERLICWPSGRLLVWLRGRSQLRRRRQHRLFTLLDWADRLELDWWRTQLPACAQEFLAWRLVEGGQIEQMYAMT